MTHRAFGPTISRVMTPDPWVVAPEARLYEAADQMLHRGFRHLVVVDGSGRLLGVVHDFSLFRHGAFGGEPRIWVEFPGAPRTVAPISESVSVVVEPETPLVTCLKRMLEAHEDVIVVVDTRHHPIGIVTEHDIVRLGS